MGCAGYLPSTKYDLVSNVCHEGKPADGFYKCHLLNKANKEWCVCTRNGWHTLSGGPYGY